MLRHLASDQWTCQHEPDGDVSMFSTAAKVRSTYQGLQSTIAIANQVIIELDDSRLEEQKQSTSTKLEVAQLFSSPDFLTLFPVSYTHLTLPTKRIV